MNVELLLWDSFSPSNLMSNPVITLETDYGKKQFVFDKIKEIAEEKQLLMINEV